MVGIPLRHGAFLPPFHPMNENPAACIERDLELMRWLDRLGCDEARIGEHHSAGWELISSPHFSRANGPRVESFDWCTDNRDLLTEKRTSAARAMFDKHEAEQQAKAAAMARPVKGREAW